MATRKIKDAEDLATNELIYFKSHAKATFMSDGKTVEEAIKSISTGDGGDSLSVYELDITEKQYWEGDSGTLVSYIPVEDVDKVQNADALVLMDGDSRIVLTTKAEGPSFFGVDKLNDTAYAVSFAGFLVLYVIEPNYTKNVLSTTIDLSNLEDAEGNAVSAFGDDNENLKEGEYFLPFNAETLEAFKQQDKVFHLDVGFGVMQLTSNYKIIADFAEYNFYQEGCLILLEGNQAYSIMLSYSQDEYPDKLVIGIERMDVDTQDFVIDLDNLRDEEGNRVDIIDEKGFLKAGEYYLPYSFAELKELKNKQAVFSYATNDVLNISSFPVQSATVFDSDKQIIMLYALSDLSSSRVYSVVVVAIDIDGIERCTLSIEDRTPVKQRYFHLGFYDEETGTWDNDTMLEYIPNAWETNQKMIGEYFNDADDMAMPIPFVFVGFLPLIPYTFLPYESGSIGKKMSLTIDYIKENGERLLLNLEIGPDGIPVSV